MTNVTGFNKIQNHPDKDEIVEKLIAGVSVREIDGWLKQKYPHNRKFQISYMSLQSFRKNFLNIEGQAIQELQQKRKELQLAKRREQQQEQVEVSVEYQKGLNNFVQSSLLDYNQEILELMETAKEGIEQLKELNFSKASHLNHQAISGYVSQIQSVVEMHRKMINDQEKKAGDQLADDYETLNQKMEILVEAVREAFNQTNPEGLFLFLEIVKEKMQEAGIQE